ncbi:MAG TPA: 6,7-dimethyl-8-ribityllumazine synthase [Planctomycetaceae bacterium]|nr:6,7-dimethyl-8-ribityllumazine synthase [Planctomycetaceae bacterium]
MIDSQIASRMGVAVSTYNANITRRLLEGALQTLQDAGFGRDRVCVSEVPGAWELPLAAKRLASRPEILGVVTLGAVIRGETSHDQHINRAVSCALMDLMMLTGKPIGFGLLTCNSMEQAIHRAGGNVGNKGQETAQAVLAMLPLEIQTSASQA